jgi:formate hydrogenlyase subunit 3/multisubunit Na+/H+ antiporter MnhD subunit
MAGLGANFEYDLRKIIALSTLSQLGLIIGAVSVGLVSLAFFRNVFKLSQYYCYQDRVTGQDMRITNNAQSQITSISAGQFFIFVSFLG